MSAMRSGRVNLPNRCYHLISRVAHRAFFLDEGERTWLVGLIRRVARFSGVDVLAYSVMSNHFHLFVYIGYPEPLGDAEIVRRIAALYSDVRFELVMKKWNELAREPGSSAFRRETARAGYDFVYGGKGRSWPELRSLHDVSIRHMLREREWRDSEDLELARTNRRPGRRGRNMP